MSAVRQRGTGTLACALFVFCVGAAQQRSQPNWYPLYIYPHPHARIEEPMRHPDMLPRVIKRVEPEYPVAARKARIAGIVVIETIVDRKGRVVAERILKPLPFGLDQKALEAVRKWRFAPAKYRGKPVASFFEVTVAFHGD